jgi:hypothetical protein
MAFTDKCNLFGAVDEEGINRVIQHVMRQRPSLFNYGTQLVANNPELWCVPVYPVKTVIDRGNPIFTVEEPLPVLGTNGLIGLNFCFQLTKLEIDFHPGNVISLPPELTPPLAEQHFALHGQVCGGIGCPPKDIIRFPFPVDTPSTNFATVALPPRKPVVIPTRELECFCLDLFVICHIEMVGPIGSQMLRPVLDGLELVDIKPDGLENSLECYLKMLMQFVILPKLSIALQKWIFEIPNLFSLAFSATPAPAEVPFNPAIEDDKLKVFVDLEVLP